jgi:serine-type D-Ala-D-Ala carboxypeptidase/endopeptidase
MKYFLAGLGLLITCTCAAADTSLLPPRINNSIRDHLAAGEYTALVVAVVDGDRSEVYSFGKLDNGKQPDSDTLFEIGSVTKTFTALLLAEQVTAGKLKLDTPVAALLPGFTIPSRNGKTVTLENLAEQHSGLPRLPSNFDPADASDPYVDYGDDKLKAFLAGYVLPRDPGSKYEYSNLGVGLLGYALARQADTSYETLLKQRIFEPLGMRSSTVTLDDASRTRVAGGHDEDGKAVGNWHLNAFAAAGGISSTGADMLRYLKANMGLLNSPLYPPMQLAHMPRTDGPKADERIGLVWMTKHSTTGDIIWHNGMTGGYASFIGFTADRKHGVVVLTNAQLQVDDLGFATLLSDLPLAPAHKRIKVLPKDLEAYVGSYQIKPGFILSVFRDGDQLEARATGQAAFPVYASSTDEFFAKVADISISFKRDASGTVNGLVLHQHGDHAAPRMSNTAADAAQGNKAITLDQATLSDYVGQYQLTPNAMFEVTLKDGQLLAKLTGQSAFPVYSSAKDKFFYRVVDAQIDFERDASGKIFALVLHQDGTDQRAKRMGD